ncbi:hypothetical protein LIER_42223 [Lithospermum erythrorhizon]|uniref:DUF4283 domain-containing protein n=1 Tax=Lithospermum erythrorhizon TaxID=34254 RepID=A0AAV3RN81_LITER
MVDGELVKLPPPAEGGIDCSPFAGNLKSNTAISFAQVAQSRPSKLLPPSLDPSIHNGKPSVVFKASEKQSLLDKLPFVLVESAIAPVWVRLEELDLSKPFIDSIWVCFEEDETKVMLDGFWVHMFYDFIPSYCVTCKHLRHGIDECKLGSSVEKAMFLGKR